MERVSKLIHADLDALVDGSDAPEEVINQVVLDMQNQLIQLKTQIAVASGHERILAERQQQKRTSAAEWLRKAQLAADKKNDDLARVSLQHHREIEGKARLVAKEIKRYQAEVESLKFLLHKLEQKMEEVQQKSAIVPLGRRLTSNDGQASTTSGAGPRRRGTHRVKNAQGADAPDGEGEVGIKKAVAQTHDDVTAKISRIDRMLEELSDRGRR
jgi:phage shock protein A